MMAVRGLRGRVTITFGAGALIVAGALASSTFLFSRAYLYDQREQTVVRQAVLDGVYVADQLDNAEADIPAVLAAAGPPGSGALLVEKGGQWYSSTLGVGPEILPREIVDRVRSGRPASMVVVRGGFSTVLVGLPLRDPEADFYRVVPLEELKETLQVLQAVLGAGTLVAAVGGIAFGVWASRRVVQPLNLVAATAAQIAGGELDSRLPPTDDPDLATIVGSFNAMVDTLRRRIDRDSRFAADVSHELRSPLTTLVAATDVLQRRRDELPERSQVALDLVVAELGRFEQLLDSLLTMARAEAGLAPDLMIDFPLVEVLTRALGRAGVPADRIRNDAGDAVVRGDPAMLERAFFNLIDNAQKHGGGLTALGLRPDDGHLQITFDDAGPGVPAEHRDRIFERFATSGTTRGSGSSTGIGLALVVEALRAHGGVVWCTEPEGGGARFVVRLPRQED